MDRISAERRSANMRRIRNRDMHPELIVRRLLRQFHLGYRIHRHDLPGKPDIVMGKTRTVIFVHGCFWHRHEGCARSFTPAVRFEFWQRKLDTNVSRDKRVQRALRELGWRVHVIWECETKNQERLGRKISEVLLIRARGETGCLRQNN